MPQLKYLFVSLALTLTWWASTASAQSYSGDSLSAGLRVYTLQEAIDTALQNDLRIAGLNAEIIGSTTARKINRLTKLPRIGYKGGALYAPHTSHFGYDPINTNGGDVVAQVTADELLYDGGKAQLTGMQLDLDLQHLQKQMALERADVIRAVTLAYIDIARTREESAIDSAVVYETHRLRDLVKRLQAGGALGQRDLLAALSEVNRAELQFAQTLTNALVARYSLAIAMGKPDDTLITAESSIDSLAAMAIQEVPSIDSARRLELALADIELKRFNLDVDLASANAKPTISMTGDAGLLSSMDNMLLSSADRGHFAGVSVGITINGPLFDWGGNDLLVQQKIAEATNKRIQNMILTRSLHGELVRLRLILRQLQHNLAMARSSIDLAAKSYERTLLLYSGGQATFNELLQSQRQYIDSRRVLLQILSDITSSKAQLDRLNAH